MTREELLKHPAYWFEMEQNELFRQVAKYMQDENINQTELAKRLNVSKGYISQILNGDFNYTLKKLTELSLAIGLVPQITYKRVEDVIKEDAGLKAYYSNEVKNISVENNIEPNETKANSFVPVKKVAKRSGGVKV